MFTEQWLVEDLVGRFERVRRNIAAWSLTPEMIPTACGLRHTYRHGRRAMVRAYASETDDRFHDWRKRVKYLRHQIEVLDPIQLTRMPTLAANLAELGEGLGLEHDFVDLEAMVSATPEAFATSADGQLLVEAISDRRRGLRDDLRPLAGRIYGAKPAEFAGQMTASWEQWRSNT
jgi:CHAD domain-containing protein